MDFVPFAQCEGRGGDRGFEGRLLGGIFVVGGSIVEHAPAVASCYHHIFSQAHAAPPCRTENVPARELFHINNVVVEETMESCGETLLETAEETGYVEQMMMRTLLLMLLSTAAAAASERT